MYVNIYMKSLLACGVLALLTACNPGPPSTLYESHCVFPHVRNDAIYNSVINVYNNTAGGNYTTEVDVLYRNEAGNVISTQVMTLGPRESHQFTQANFTGSVDIKGLGVSNAMQCVLETRDVNNQGVALAQKATILERLSVPWFYQLNVNDEGPGQLRTALITANLWFNDPIFIRYSPVAPGIGCAALEVEIPPGGYHMFYPLDVFAASFPTGMQHVEIGVQGNTGPNSSGSQLVAFSGAQFVESPGAFIALDNYATISKNAWGGINAKRQAYLVDVQDDGVNRTDRIIVKSTNGANAPSPDIDYQVHMYDANGVAVAGPPTISLTEHFNDPGSVGAFSPMALAGGPFSGSIWIEPPLDTQNFSKKSQVSVAKQSSSGWQDTVSQVAAKDWPSSYGVIPYVSNQDTNWDYRLAFFYPETIYKAVPGSELEGDVFGGPGDTPPAPVGGVVVLNFYEGNGQHLGWLAFQMQPNQTRYFAVDDIANTYFGENFAGAIEFSPHIAQQIELQHAVSQAHGTTSNWTAGQSDY